MRISTVVPSYSRPNLLFNFLRAIEAQSRPPDEVIIVLRDTDKDSRGVLDAYRAGSRLPLIQVLVSRPGYAAAMNAGLDQVTGDVLCCTDDDAEPLPDWVGRIEVRFAADPKLGALGGRDHIYMGGILQPTVQVETIGKLQWFGRMIGNHSQDSMGCREVDCLKGCNMSFRTELRPRFDERFLGDAYQVEVAICLAVRRQGMKILYDSEIRVNHFLGSRQDGTERLGFSPDRLFNNSHNHILARMPHLPLWRQAVYVPYTFLVGDHDTPGFVKSLHLSRGNPAAALRVLAPSLRGKVAGLATWLADRRPVVP